MSTWRYDNSKLQVSSERTVCSRLYPTVDYKEMIITILQERCRSDDVIEKDFLELSQITFYPNHIYS